MIKIAVHGICGKMGQITAQMISSHKDAVLAYGIDPFAESGSFGGAKVFRSTDEVPYCENADVIIDFSNFKAVPALVAFAEERKLPAVVCTTGLDVDTKELLYNASKVIPVFHSANMSVGVALLKALAAKASLVLGDQFDIEIVEKHHNQKVDAPSGTAIMLADAINETLDNSKHFVYDRHSRRQKREKTEIGMHSIRGGTIVGEHDVIFAGHDEVLTLSHSAASKSVFAEGAINAALFLKDQPAGLYDMSKLV